MEGDLTLRRGAIVLRPLRLEDAPALHAIVSPETWAGMSAPFPTSVSAMRDHLDKLMATAGLTAFAVEKDGVFVGRTAFYDYVPVVRVDVGYTIYDPQVWGTNVNPTCKWLLLNYAFDALKVHRVGLRCDHRNERSRLAIARLGATFEGTLRAFRPSADGSIADVDYFSITSKEWPVVKVQLEQRLKL